ncbi:hypothetical protein LCGC14_2017490, partial [marine sediment metagenome]
YELTLNSNSANYSAREILNTPWVKTKRLTEFPMKPIPFYCKSNIKQWWIPAPDRIPQTLPPFAIDGQQWKLFSEHSPKQDDYVEIRGHRRWWIEKGWIKQGVSLPNKPIKNYIWLEKDHEVFGLSALPADVQNCSLIPVGIVALVTIDPTVDDDVRLGGKILVRHDKDIVSGDWINSVSIFASTSSGELNSSAIVSGQKTQFFVPLKTGTYLFKFQDSAGFTSLNACSQVLEAFSLDGFQTLDTITENPSFSGTHTNTTVNDGLLRLELYSDVSPSTEVISQGTYLFNGSFDFGARKKVRITSTIGVTIVLVNDLIDNRLDNIDTWASFDGILGSDADAQMFIRYQTTDPAVPDFGPWQSIQTSGEFDIWAAEFKVELSSFSSVANIHIDTLSMIAEEPLAL